MVLCGTGILKLCNPPLYEQLWRCFGCGRTERGPDLRPPTAEDVDRRRWELANATITGE